MLLIFLPLLAASTEYRAEVEFKKDVMRLLETSDPWLLAVLGRSTLSEFPRLLTPSGRNALLVSPGLVDPSLSLTPRLSVTMDTSLTVRNWAADWIAVRSCTELIRKVPDAEIDEELATKLINFKTKARGPGFLWLAAGDACKAPRQSTLEVHLFENDLNGVLTLHSRPPTDPVALLQAAKFTWNRLLETKKKQRYSIHSFLPGQLLPTIRYPDSASGNLLITLPDYTLLLAFQSTPSGYLVATSRAAKKFQVKAFNVIPGTLPVPSYAMATGASVLVRKDTWFEVSDGKGVLLTLVPHGVASDLSREVTVPGWAEVSRVINGFAPFSVPAGISEFSSITWKSRLRNIEETTVVAVFLPDDDYLGEKVHPVLIETTRALGVLSLPPPMQKLTGADGPILTWSEGTGGLIVSNVGADEVEVLGSGPLFLGESISGSSRVDVIVREPNLSGTLSLALVEPGNFLWTAELLKSQLMMKNSPGSFAAEISFPEFPAPQFILAENSRVIRIMGRDLLAKQEELFALDFQVTAIGESGWILENLGEVEISMSTGVPLGKGSASAVAEDTLFLVNDRNQAVLVEFRISRY